MAAHAQSVAAVYELDDAEAASAPLDDVLESIFSAQSIQSW